VFELDQLIMVCCGTLVHVLIIRYLNFNNIRRSITANIFLFVVIFMFTIFANNIISITSVRFPAIALIVAVCAILIFKLGFFESLALTLIGNFILIVGDFAVLLVFVNILKLNFSILHNSIYKIIASSAILLVTVLIIVIRQYLRRKSVKSKLSTKSFFIICVVFIIIICAFNLFFNARIISINPSAVKIYNLTAFAIYFVICLFLIFLYFTSNNQKLILEQQTREYEHLIEYTGVIENLYEDIRNQKHDFMNVLFSIKGFLDNNQFDKLKDYYNNDILAEYDEKHPNCILSSLNMIKHPGLKGILAYKLNQAVNTNINVFVNIFEVIHITGMETIDLCKIVGILIDNAIEASIESSRRELHLGIEENERGVSTIIANTYRIEPDLNQIYKRGFSTKGKNRGLGLYNVKETLSRYPSVLLITTIENNTFFQELIIPPI